VAASFQFGVGSVRLHPGCPLLLQLHRRGAHQRHQDALEALRHRRISARFRTAQGADVFFLLPANATAVFGTFCCSRCCQITVYQKRLRWASCERGGGGTPCTYNCKVQYVQIASNCLKSSKLCLQYSFFLFTRCHPLYNSLFVNCVERE
jgi:hypothetical protein